MSPHWLTREALRARGAKVALRSRTAEVSYEALAQRAEAVAKHLETLRIRAGDRVAIASGARGHDEAVALAAVLTLGAVVVPLDATAPPRRLAAMAEASGCRAIICDEAALKLASAIAEEGPKLARVLLDAEGSVVEASGAAPEVAPGDTSLACVLHTSGSTGTPKPVPVTWEGLEAFTSWAIDCFALTEADRVLRVAELHFDLAWFDHLATFRAGATLVTMSRRDLASGRALGEAIKTLEPTVIYGVPSMFMKLAALSPCPRVVMFAGEVFPPRELLAFAEKAPLARLYNLFGPTETNVCTFHEVDRSALDGERETPIGRACPYADCRLIDEETGAVIEGAGSAELVVTGPTTLGGGPFATRDRVLRGEDGLYYFRGRIDRMVKVRGYRVEPAEVEHALLSHPDVRQAAIVVVDDPRMGKTLRAFVVLTEGEDRERALRMHLAERLPSYMVPEKVSTIAEMPLTANGKVDYAALLARA